ncbi:MAG: hypothetical protein ACRC0V_01600, partial [Fusobacteriaceae bacterium]
KHGLESWGEDFGVPKPKIDDWQNLSIKEYIHRCKEDVSINFLLFKKEFKYLKKIYPSYARIKKIINYLNFKLECLEEQERVGIKIDIPKIHENLKPLEKMFFDKQKILSSVMPKEGGKLLKKKPSVLFKKNGDISESGLKWFKYLVDNNLPRNINEVREEPNPGSSTQLKSWLFSLGWIPVVYKENKKKELIPQVSIQGEGLCESVKILYEIEPQLEELDMYYKIRHRIGMLNSFLNEEKDSRVKATAHGFTNTLRMKHAVPCVNMPKPSVFYGDEIRSILIPDEGQIMCGSDVSSLEDNTKQHYIYFFDPDYVNEMRVPGFDPHLDISILAKLITIEQSDFFKLTNKKIELENYILFDEEKKKYAIVKIARGKGKTVNFASTYGAGAAKIAKTAKISLEEGKLLHKIYWERNKAIKEVVNSCEIKEVNGQKWLYNPLSQFYIFLKNEKDIFSSLNQNTGVYVFDNWVKIYKQNSIIPVRFQAHDELMLTCFPEQKEIVDKILRESMKKVNEMLKLNVEIGISIDYGHNYAECH